MAAHEYPGLEERAVQVLAANDRGTHVAPSPPVYPEQWLWDSAYAAIGLAHVDAHRAARELRSILEAQWPNGMVPHMVFRAGGSTAALRSRLAARLWNAGGAAPPGVATSGITQPPVLAEAARRVGVRLGRRDRAEFLAAVVPRLVRYHRWLYRERDVAGDGLVASVHPWETGMDDTPPWIEHLRAHERSLLVRAATRLSPTRVVDALRTDTRAAGPGERISVEDSILCLSAMLRLRRLRSDPARLAREHRPLIEDVAVNSILVRNNAVLRELAAEASVPLGDGLGHDMERTAGALPLLWDEEAGLFFSREVRTGRLLAVPTAASLLPLYVDGLPRALRSRLVRHLDDPGSFAAPYPVPTVPPESDRFSEARFWCGPTWVNVNWHLLDGAARAGEDELADRLRRSTLEMVSGAGMHEYFSALDGRGLGAPRFSWTAALTIDLLHRR